MWCKTIDSHTAYKNFTEYIDESKLQKSMKPCDELVNRVKTLFLEYEDIPNFLNVNDFYKAIKGELMIKKQLETYVECIQPRKFIFG